MNVRRLISFLVIASIVVVTGCSRCQSSEVKKREAAERIAVLSEALPATADAAVVVPEINAMRLTVDRTLERVSQFQPQIRMMEQQLARELGIRVTDESSWRESGIDPESTLLVAVVGNRPVLATFVADRQKFEGRFVDRLRRSGNTESPIRNETVGGQSYKVSGDGAGNDMAWFYRENMVFLAMPPFDALGAYEEGTALAIINGVAQTSAENSLGRSAAFLSYRAGLGDEYPISMYIDAEKYFERPEADRLETGFDSIIESLAKWSQSNARGAGFGLLTDEGSLVLRTFVGGEQALVEEARAAFGTGADVDWKGFLTTNTVLAVRTGFDLSKAMETYLESLPDEERRRLARQMTQLGRSYQLDMEEDVIRAFSGQSLLAFYGIGGDMGQLMAVLNGQNPADIIRTMLANSGLLMGLHFADEGKLEVLMEKADEFTGDFVQRRPLVYQGEQKADAEVLEPRALNLFPGRLFRQGDVVTVAAAGIGENAAYEYMTAARTEGSLADSEAYRLGQQFGTQEGMNGMYLNFENLRRNLRRVPLAGGFATQLEAFHELLIQAEVEEEGFYVTATLSFTEDLVAPPGEEDSEESE